MTNAERTISNLEKLLLDDDNEWCSVMIEVCNGDFDVTIIPHGDSPRSITSTTMMSSITEAIDSALEKVQK